MVSQKSIVIKIKNDISELEKVNQVFEQFAENHQLLLKITNPVSLALDEILNNIISYGYSDNENHEIKIEIQLSETLLKIQIEDDGLQFDPFKVEEADTKSEIEEREVGGLGMHLVKNMLDDLSYEYKNKKNCLILEKNI